MNSINHTRAGLAKGEEPIRLGIVGVGAMGKGLFYQSLITPAIRCVALADLQIERCLECAAMWNVPARIVSNATELADALRADMLALCRDGTLLAECEGVDVFLEASGSILAGGRFVEGAILTGKHVVLMNAEVDLTFGPYLSALAHAHNVVYTSCDGDQPGVIARLIRETTGWGMKLVVAGNIKGFLDRYTNPTAIIPEAEKRHLDYRMATSYADGTKLNIEMALIANAFGLKTPAPGMTGPRAASVQEALTLFDPTSSSASKDAWVDYILGAEPGGGVFVISYCGEPYQQGMLEYYKMGSGPYYLFYRPYHLCHIEAMQCIFDAARTHRSLLEPTFGLNTNVFAYAKRALKRGEKLDGVGGYTCYGLIENCPGGEMPPGLPVCLAENATMKRDIAPDEKIHLDDVEYDVERYDFVLYDRAVRATTRSSDQILTAS